MLSILIPVYNFRVDTLLKELLKQGKSLQVPFEIRLYDDASGFDYGPEIALGKEAEQLVFQVLGQNLGRAKIRNKLASEARYPWLLFMDADSAVISPDYLRNYWNHKKADVLLVGGTSYSMPKPVDSRQVFRWHYGRHREQRSAAQRQHKPFEGFSTHHFFCHRMVFEQVSFPVDHKGYGHEDTLFGFALEKAGFKVLHLDNPLDHIGLESADLFIKKTKEGLENLHLLKRANPRIRTRLSDLYQSLHRWHLAWLPILFYRLLGSRLESYFRNGEPALMLFDLYKLGYFAKLEKQGNASNSSSG